MNEIIDRAIEETAHLAPNLREDIESVATLAYLEYQGVNPLFHVKQQIRQFIRHNKSNTFDPIKADRIFNETQKPTSLSPCKKLSLSKRKKLRRNIVIQAAHRQGCSQRLIADVFGLPRSLVATIIAKNLAKS